MRHSAALAALCLAAPVWAAKPVPPSPSSYVHNEDVVGAGTAGQLSALLRDSERKTGHQFVVALFQSLDGEDLETYVNRVFKEWRIGDAKRNDGLLFAVFLKDRRWRVEVGYGLESTVTDLEASDIVTSRAVPRFKSGDYDAGILEAASALSEKIHAAPGAHRPQKQYPWSSWTIEQWFMAVLIGFPIAYGLLLAVCWVLIEALDRIATRITGKPRTVWNGLNDLLEALLSAYSGERPGYASFSSGGSYGGGGGYSGGGFSGGGGSSGGGGASGSW
jgi:uncharacterized protein